MGAVLRNRVCCRWAPLLPGGALPPLGSITHTPVDPPLRTQEPSQQIESCSGCRGESASAGLPLMPLQARASVSERPVRSPKSSRYCADFGEDLETCFVV